ncbi:MAG TPA: metal-dependent transcriptional regulator [Deinococcales bacterium]|nr:metal-dependent transcriptional regulator [Deinococcales bacterium]
MERPPLSAAAEDYVKQLYLIGHEAAGAATTQSVADALHVTPASATGMLRRLAELELVDYTAYHGATLTANGRSAALSLLRRHRLLESFLHRVLGYALDEVHEEAEALEHAMSDTLVERLDAFLGRPEFDPHGDPIPRPGGELPDQAGIALSQVAPGTLVRVRRVPGGGAVLRSLAGWGVTPGQLARVTSCDPGLGVLTLVVNGQAVTLASAAAAQVLVEPTGEASE